LKTSRTFTAALLAGAALLLTPVPAHAATCPAGQHWNAMGAGSGFCAPDDSGGGTGGSGTFDGGGSTPVTPPLHLLGPRAPGAWSLDPV